jgi:hypothetical protein
VKTQTIVIAFPSTMPQGAVIEAAIDAAQEIKFPPATKIDKVVGIVELGGFEQPQLGIAAQARIKSEGQFEITITRWSEFIPISLDGPTDQFKAKLKAKVAEITQRVGR